jgi:ankyrin repeat protein
MRDKKSIKYFATEQAIPEHQQPCRLDKSPTPSFAQSSDRYDAQEYMLHLRHNINGKKLPEKSLWAKMKIRTQSKIEKLNATFTAQERYDAFDHFLRSRKPIGTAQAILEFHSGQVIDVNVRHDIAGEKSGSRLKRAESSAMVEESRWLQTAVESDQEDYVCLLCAHHPAQANLDEALKIAARLNFIAIATELLRSGANPNTCHKEFRKRSSNGDMVWTTMLLGSRLHEIDQEEKDKALLAAVNNNNFDMAHLLLSAKADAASSSGAPLASAVRTVNFRMLTLLISEPARIEKASLRGAMESACDYSSLRISNRVQFINILLSAGAEVPSALRKNLLKNAVSGNDVALVSLLVKHKQLSGSEATAALEYVVKVPSETDVVRISRSLLAAGATVADMGEVLHWAVQKDYRTMVALLVGQGVSIDFKEAVVVQLALARQDIQLLKLLLLGDSDASKTSVSSGTTLASVLPQALSLSTQKMRHEAIELLVRKGLDGEHLHRALLSVITNPAICNADLALKLLQGGASVNFRENQENCIISAAKDGNLLLLELLIAREWKATPQILSDTVLTLCIFRERSPFAHLKRSMTTLLQGGAVCNGRQVAQAFLILAQAAEDVECAELAELLLQHGADVNFQDGQIIKHALILSNENLLTAICGSERINKNSFVHVIQLAIDGARTDQTRLSLLTHACRRFQSEMSDSLVSEIRSGPSGGQDEIIDLLLSNGAQVNYKNGVVFEHIINGSSKSRSIVHLSWLLRKDPGELALKTAFASARRFQCTLDHRYRLFELILKAGHRGNDVNETLNDVIVSNQADLSMSALLLEHGADINAAGGVALSSATSNANLELLSKMITYELSVETVDRAFRVACATEVSKACKYRLFACLLSTGRVSKDCVTYALTLSITRGSLEEHLLSLLCEHGALIETEALVYLVDREDIVAARFLLGLQTPNKKCRSQAVKASLGLEKSIRLDFAKLLVIHGLSRAEWTEALHTSIKDHDLELLKLLLQHGSNREREVEGAIVIAASTLNPDLMKALLAGAPSSRARNEAFESLLDPKNIHSTSGFMAVALLLLESGVDQALRDRALIQTLEAFPQDRSDFFQILIQHGADVNAKACTSFVTAGQFETLDVFNLLLQSRANFDQVIKSLVSQFPVDKYVRLLQLVFIVLRCELYRSDRLDSSVILQAMHRFKHGENLIRLLLDHGYPPGESTRSGDHDNARAEFVTPLIWALGQPGPGVSDKVILELLGKEKEGQSFVGAVKDN